MQDRSHICERDPERLVRTYANLIMRVCYTYLHSTADAEDICQETLMKLLQHQESFHDLDHERAWVLRVASNACKNMLRNYSAHPEVSLDVVEEPVEVSHPSESRLQQRSDRVLAAVMALSLSLREVVYLYYYEGFCTSEIAQIVGANNATVRQRLRRARILLKNDLKGEYDDFPA